MCHKQIILKPQIEYFHDIQVPNDDGMYCFIEQKSDISPSKLSKKDDVAKRHGASRSDNSMDSTSTQKKHLNQNARWCNYYVENYWHVCILM